jgi:uncharacterized protein YjbI with pentapeptide repeats
MEKADLDFIIEKHRKWLLNKDGGERASLRGADLSCASLRGADLRCADLRDADLSSADLSFANLSGADLSCASLRGADLRCADLRDADLSSADLRGASLRGADLRCADLSFANLSGADLSDANLSSADLRGADLSSADLSYANLSGANLSGAKLPIVSMEPDLIAKILERVEAEPSCLSMETWHACETTHCLAGWAVTLHSQGTLLESMVGPNVAGAMIFNACCGEVPDFFSGEETAVEWLRQKSGKVIQNEQWK